MNKLIAACLALTTLVPAAFAQDFKVVSPDGKVEIGVNNQESLLYQVNFNSRPLIYSSVLGFEFANEPAMGSGLKILGTEKHTVNEVWHPVVRSKHQTVTNNYNELELQLVEKAGLMRRMNLYFRAYNEGIAFRYQLFGSGKIGDRTITRELTGFTLAGKSKTWVAEYGGYASGEESEFWPRNLNYITEKTVAGLPLLVEVNKDTYAAISEANIDNYPGFFIGSANADTTSAEKITLTTKLAPLPGEKESGSKARFSNNMFTPWRVVMLANSPGKLIESELIQSLNPPCAIKNPEWIKPGMSAWDHWWSGEVKMDMPTIKSYIDLASAQNWPYMLIDWQWYGPYNKPEADITKPAPQLDMPEILRYAKSKNVRCWVWLYSSDVNRNDNFEKAFALYEKWGIAGIKIDFMERDDQQMVNWYRKIIMTAAAHHLMVDFHGAYKPDGIIRTYPNMVTREGVMGEEYSKFSNRVTPEHNTTLPFTRMLAGQMDYTPGGFLNVTKAQFKKTTPTVVMNSRCAELSKFVIYESPFTVYCDAPENILGKQGADFLKAIPTVWDDIKVLGGHPGEFVLIAKRSGNTWYVGAMNNSKARTIQLKTDFLPTGKYNLTSWSDVESEPQKLTKATQAVNSGTTITVKMDVGGGWAGKIIFQK